MQKSTVFHLVYRYLNEVADRDLRWRQRNNAYNRFRRQHARRKNIRTRASTLTRTSYGAGIGDACARPDQKGLPETLGTLRSSSEECIADYARAVHDGTLYIQTSYMPIIDMYRTTYNQDYL